MSITTEWENLLFGKNSPSDLVHGKLALQKSDFHTLSDIVVWFAFVLFLSFPGPQNIGIIYFF